MFEKTIPQDRAAEAAVVGSILVDSACIANVLEIVDANDFFEQDLKLLFEIARTLWLEHKGEGIDGLLVRSRLSNTGRMTKELLDIMLQCLNTVPNAANAVYYAKQVKLKSAERDMISSVDRISQSVYDYTLSLEEKQLIFQQAALQLKQNIDEKKVYDVSQIVMDVIDRFNRKQNYGIYTGFSRLDQMTMGFAGGQLIILAGRPSIGKSSLAGDVMLNMAKAGKRILIFSAETSKERIVQRMIANIGKLNLHSLFRYGLQDNQLLAFRDACETLKSYKIFISDQSYLTPVSITAEVIRQKSQNEIDIVFVDYLQLVFSGKQKVENRQQEITYISAQFKQLAKRYNLPVVLLAQLNRACESREDHRPRLSDLRESGSIEQDADIVLFLHRDDYYRKKENPDAQEDGNAKLIIAKNKDGETGDVELVWLPQYFSFADKANENEV